MTEKRFTLKKYTSEDYAILDDGTEIAYASNKSAFTFCELLNGLHEENEQLKKELQTYRKVAGCFNCRYHNYDWYEDGDEFEVCDKGKDVTEGICEEWEEL